MVQQFHFHNVFPRHFLQPQEAVYIHIYVHKDYFMDEAGFFWGHHWWLLHKQRWRIFTVKGEGQRWRTSAVKGEGEGAMLYRSMTVDSFSLSFKATLCIPESYPGKLMDACLMTEPAFAYPFTSHLRVERSYVEQNAAFLKPYCFLYAWNTSQWVIPAKDSNSTYSWNTLGNILFF